MLVNDNPNQTIEDVVNKAPMYNKEDMECLTTRWLSIDDKEMADKNRKRKQKQKFPTLLGSKSYTRLAKEREVEKGSGVGRSELFPIAHTKKDGTPVNEEAKEAILKMTKLMATQPFPPSISSEGSIYWASNDVYAQVMGNKCLGCVRGVGLGPIPDLSISLSLSPSPASTAIKLHGTAIKLH